MATRQLQTAPSSCKYCPAWRGSRFNYRSVSVPLPKQAASSPADKVNEATFTPPAVTYVAYTPPLAFWVGGGPKEMTGKETA